MTNDEPRATYKPIISRARKLCITRKKTLYHARESFDVRARPVLFNECESQSNLAMISCCDALTTIKEAVAAENEQKTWTEITFNMMTHAVATHRTPLSRVALSRQWSTYSWPRADKKFVREVVARTGEGKARKRVWSGVLLCRLRNWREREGWGCLTIAVERLATKL